MNKKDRQKGGVDHTTFIVLVGLLIITLGGAVHGVGRYYEEQLEFKDTQLDILRKEDALKTKAYSETIASLTTEKEEAEKILEDSFDKFDLLTAVRNAGLTELLTEEEIRDMLELLDKAPYGSPFARGHWISSHYGNRDESAINGDNWTDGVDLVGKYGDREVRTIADGIITDMGFSDIYGKYIEVTHGDTYKTKYSHLNKIYWQNLETHAVVGEKVNKGDKIGVMGNTGLCWSDNGGDGSHLDLRLYMKDNGGSWKAVDPEIVIQRIGGGE